MLLSLLQLVKPVRSYFVLRGRVLDKHQPVAIMGTMMPRKLITPLMESSALATADFLHPQDVGAVFPARGITK
jgi:hypothetical protein